MEVMQRGYADAMIHSGQPDKRWVEFQTRPWRNKAKSREMGSPQFEAVTFITIQHPGDNLNKIERPATEQDKIEFARQWQAFEQGREPIPDGTLLSILLPNNPEVVETLRYQKIYTIQQLAALNDTQLQSIGMGGFKLRQDAQTYLDAASDGKEFHKLRDQVEKLAAGWDADKQKIAALEAALAAQGDEEPRRGPGRPRKDAA